MMTSLKQQMEELQKQQAILAEKIQEEEERNKKLSQDASIDRLEALIEPITQSLDWVCPDHPDSPTRLEERRSARHFFNNNFEIQMRKRRDRRSAPLPKYQFSHMLVNEEIFVTLLGIIKKQDARIYELETIIKGKNKEVQYSGPHDGESWNYA
jgi:hypothetical protein